MIKRLKNNTGATRKYIGTDIEAGQYYTVERQEWDLWLAHPDIETDLTSGDLVFNDGTSDYPTVSEGIDMWRAIDASCVRGVVIDASGIGEGQALVYDSASGKVKYGNHDDLNGSGSNSHTQIDSHLSNTSNPHSVTKIQVGLGNVDNTSDANKPVSTAQQTALDAKVDDSEKGAANGVATLDGAGKVPSSQLAISALSYKGTWDANANSPTLSDSGGGGAQGDYYVVSTAGTTSIDGISDWAVGDWIVNNGSTWEKVDNTDSVTSVAGKAGVVTLDADDVSETGSKKWLSSSDKSKLDGIASGATANDTDANLKARANHTGTQTKSTISDFSHALGGSEHSSSTLSELNAKISDATLIDTGDSRLSDARTPTSHSHNVGDVDLNSASEDTSPDENNDYLFMYDASAGANKKVKLTNLPGVGDGASFAEAFDTISTTSSGSWVSRTLSGYANKIVMIEIQNDSNGSRTCGARAYGSSMDRKASLGRDAVWTLFVQADGSGRIEIYGDGSSLVFRNTGSIS